MVEKMNSGSQNDGIIYKAAAFAIFVILVTLIVLATISPRTSDEIPTPGTNPTTDPPVTSEPDVPKDTTAPVSSKVTEPVTDTPVTTKPSDTTVPAETTNPAVTTQSSDTAKAPEVTVPTGNTPDAIAGFLSNYPKTVLAESEDAGQDYIDKIVFLGDSTTYGLRRYKVLSGGKDTTQVWTPTNGTITLSYANTVLIWYPETDKEMTIKDAAALKKPEYLVITLGVNGVSFMGEEYFKKEYGKLIKSIQDASPDTKIILQSIFPVASNYELLKSINNEKIDAANEWVVQIAEEYGVKYLDTNSRLRDENGWLKDSYQNGDGLHLSEAGLNVELNNLRTHAWVD